MDSPNFLWLVISVVLHLLFIFPFLASWLIDTPPPPGQSGPVSVHFGASAAGQGEGQGGGGSFQQLPSQAQQGHGGSGHRQPSDRTQSHPHSPNRQHVKPTRTTKPINSHQEKPPSLDDEGSYPTALPPSGTSAGSGIANGTPGGGQGPGTGGNGPGRPGGSVGGGGTEGGGGGGQGGQGHTFQPVRMSGMATNVTVPPSLQSVELGTYEMRMEVTIDVNGAPKVRIMESSGSAQYDQFMVEQVMACRWTPALEDGRPKETVLKWLIHGKFDKGSLGITLHTDNPNSKP